MMRSLFRTCSLVLLLFAVLASAVFTAPVQAGAPAHQADPGESMLVARLYYADLSQLRGLAARLDVWESHPDQKMIVVYISQSQLADLQAEGYTLQVDADKTAMVNTPRVIPEGQINGIPGYTCYRTVEETYTSLQNLNTTYPGLVMKSDIGDSWDKIIGGGPAGYDIYALRLTNESFSPAGGKFRFFLMAEIHAREYVTSEIATRFAEYLLAQYGSNPDITWLLDYGEIHIVAMTNPDGRKKAEAGALWRKNTDSDDGCSSSTSWGTDLNRNSSTLDWGGEGTTNDPCGETYHGPSPASEPEVQTIQNYVSSILPDLRGPGQDDPAPEDYQGLFITLHSYSNLVLWPWGSVSADAPNGTDLQTLGRKMAYFNGYDPHQSVELYPTTGGTDDWAYETLGVPGYTFEIGDEFFQSCSTFESYIYFDNRDSLLYAFKAAHLPYMTPAGPEVVNPAVNPGSVMPGVSVTLTGSANDTRYNNSGGPEPTQAISAARYSIDQPSWIAGTVTYPMAAADGTFNSTIENLTASVDTSGLAPGRHTLLIEAQDAAGNWGVPSAIFINIDTPISGYAQLTPAVSEVGGQPGETSVHTLTLTNIGLASTQFTLSVGGSPAWVTGVSPQQVTLASNESAEVTVTVDVPADAGGGITDSALITAVPDGSPEFADTATTLTFLSNVVLTPNEAAGSGAPGTPVVYTLNITSYADVYRTFDVTAGAHSWPVTISPALLSLNPGQTKPVTVTVTIPAGAQNGDSEALVIRTENRADRRHFDTSTLTTTAEVLPPGVDLAIPDASQSALPGAQVIYTVTLTNTSAQEDSFDISLAGNAWVTEAPIEVGPLASGASITFDVTVTVPASAAALAEDTVTVTAASQANSALTDTLDLTTTALQVYAAGLDAPLDAQVGQPGTQVTYEVVVTNNGNGADEFTFAVSGNAWTVNFPASSGILSAGASLAFDVTVTIPVDAQDADFDSALLSITSAGDPSVTADVTLTTTASVTPLVKLYLPLLVK